MFCEAGRSSSHPVQSAANRGHFGQSIARFQDVDFQVADMMTRIFAANWLTLPSAWRLDEAPGLF
ncbi:acyl-CoA dehydrogenase family protein [Amaricoccus macauensis]|uniref:acyl-CoA dehydrogenase family protein n=1 Tax=Amaricoccus macauensis TaxID=57001 RepID=UPI003C79C8C3